MELSKKEVNLQKIHAALFSADDAEVEKALATLVSKGTELSILPLIELYASTETAKHKKIAEKLLYSLKTSNASIYLVEALQEIHYEDIKVFILSIFWNAGIPPHLHILELVEEAVHGDFLIAFEVLTILENIDGEIDPLILESAISEVSGSLDFAQDNDKTKILSSIHEILIGFQNNEA